MENRNQEQAPLLPIESRNQGQIPMMAVENRNQRQIPMMPMENRNQGQMPTGPMENRNQGQMRTGPMEQQGPVSSSSSREVRGVVIVSVPVSKDGKTVCAAFTFQDQQQQQSVTTNCPPQYAPVQTQAVEQTIPPPGRRTETFRKFAKRIRLIVAILLVLGVAAFVLFRRSAAGMIEEQWDDNEEWAHVHKLYAKRLISMAPGNRTASRDYIPENGLVMRDYSRRKLWERVVRTGSNVNTSTTFDVHGNVYPDGLYYMRLHVGTPPRSYFVDIDTGSDLTWLQCNAPCVNCAETPHPWYDPGRAKIMDCRQPACSLLQHGSGYGCSGGVGQCDYEIEYGDTSSTMGVLVSDQISIQLTNGSYAQTNAVFGCSYDQRGSLAESPSKTDGLLGLNSGKLGLPAQLAAAGLVKNVIAHCLAGGNRGGGYLFLGDELVPSWGMAWTPMVKKHDEYRERCPDPSVFQNSCLGGGVQCLLWLESLNPCSHTRCDHYFVSVSKIQYGSTSLEDGEEYDFIFDSGTSYTYLVPQLYQAFIEAVLKGLEGSGLELDLADTTLPYCWKGKTPFRSVTDASHHFQQVTLHFGTSWFLASRYMVIIPQSYLIITPSGNVCMGIMDSADAGSEEINIIGDISLRGHLVVYDNVHHRVGWMPSDCRKPLKAKAFTFV